MKGNSIIVIGAGAAGLIAAKELSAAGYEVTILEAADYTGGRIKTVHSDTFGHPVEEGAEFIHGQLPLTLQLLQEATIPFHPIQGKMLRNTKGKWHQQHEMAEGWDELISKMDDCKEDMTLGDFLENNFKGSRYDDLKKSVKRFAEGFDLADIQTASMFALRDEWEHEEDDQYRIPGGYSQLTDYLLKQSLANGAVIYHSCVVKQIAWQRNEVIVTTTTGERFTAQKIIITVSLGVLSGSFNEHNVLDFMPAIPEYIKAAQDSGFGTVTKVLLQFSEPFWEKYVQNAGFILSEEIIPTWWTQLPAKESLLTGWLGGPSAINFSHYSDDEVVEKALQSLCVIFSVEIAWLKQLLTAFRICHWQKYPFIKGAYTYSSLKSNSSKQVLNTPIENTIFFAGEGVYEGSSPGTVEAALVTGKNVAKKILEMMSGR